ncbi:carbohydrate ABC transporter permease [Alkalicoccobacillus murimartini]|uniref:Multiple sugar transport system permease protein n=1 Tax=Alkalicoccobacillus murimartini TaxID=171685 RepID=A0ABT9YHC1_9BACI|nr:sugar ABC transporter permease [Alkalicoccobacillus murimartini]MDQ0207245.1 multiple sugar transport system permease protein [Alkalicoccobacillus murimartini]
METIKSTEKTLTVAEKKRIRKKTWRESLTAYLVISPWLIGFFGLVIGPMMYSFYLSFTNYNMLTAPVWTGLTNYVKLFTNDPRFIQSLKATFTFVIIAVPLKLAFSLFLAMVFNAGKKGSGFLTTMYYVPSIIGGSVAIAVVWRQLFGRNGAVNTMLDSVGLNTISFFGDSNAAMSILVLLVVWQFGAPMIIFLAGLRQIPKDLYEAASVDGANRVVQFFKVTLPMLTPIIFFNLIMEMIGGFMTFTQAFLVTGGGPRDSTLFYAVYLYEVAFEFLNMGYASAMAWVLLLIIGAFTLIIFKTSSLWVHYDSDGGN